MRSSVIKDGALTQQVVQEWNMLAAKARINRMCRFQYSHKKAFTEKDRKTTFERMTTIIFDAQLQSIPTAIPPRLPLASHIQ